MKLSKQDIIDYGLMILFLGSWGGGIVGLIWWWFIR